jgi:hypothetical protein
MSVHVCWSLQRRVRVQNVAVQFLDHIWATLVLLGIEKLRVIKSTRKKTTAP